MKSKQKADATHMVGRSSFTIEEFCLRNGLSNWFYLRMRKEGLAPQEMRVNGIVRITLQAERQWHRDRSNPAGAEAEAVEQQKSRREKASRESAAKVNPENRRRQK